MEPVHVETGVLPERVGLIATDKILPLHNAVDNIGPVADAFRYPGRLEVFHGS